MMGWAFLLAAIVLEVVGTLFLKLSHGFERWHWGLASIGCYAACFGMLSPAMKYLPLGVVYAIWAGVGVVAAVMIGWFAFDERLSAMQFICVAMVLVGAVGLRLSTNA